MINPRLITMSPKNRYPKRERLLHQAETAHLRIVRQSFSGDSYGHIISLDNVHTTYPNTCLCRILRIHPFVNHRGKDVNSDWLADQWDERSVLGHAQINKGRMKGDDPQLDTAQTPKRFDRRLALQENIQVGR